MAEQKKLTIKEQAFVDNILVHGVASRAYTEAGYRAKNANIAAVEGHKLLKRPRVAAAVEKARKACSERTGVDADKLIDLLLKEATTSPSPTARVSALTTLARIVGLMREKVDVRVEEPTVQAGTMSAVLSSSEGQQLLARLRAEAQHRQQSHSPVSISPDASQVHQE
jgi:hypothetical protein